MKKFWKLLTKSQKKHLHEMGVFNIAGFERLREHQLRKRKEGLEEGLSPGIANPCFECDEIAAKVGMQR